MLVLTDVQKVTLAIAPKSAAGNPAQVDGAPLWTLSDESILTLTVAEDGLSAEAVTTGKVGTTQVNVQADADLGEGKRAITGVLEIEVKASEAVTLDISAGTPTDK